MAPPFCQESPHRVTFIVYFLLDVGALNSMLPFSRDDVGDYTDKLFLIAFASFLDGLTLFEDNIDNFPFIKWHNDPPLHKRSIYKFVNDVKWAILPASVACETGKFLDTQEL